MPGQPNPVPPDDLSRRLTVARPDEDQDLPHIGLVGDTYTILVTGRDTEGKYTLIDMHVPPGGGSSSVLNRGARLLAFAINAACSSGLSGGGA